MISVINRYIYMIKILNNFLQLFMEHIKEEISLGIESKNNAILTYHRYVVQGADSASSIMQRNEILNKFFTYYEQNKKILFGDT